MPKLKKRSALPAYMQDFTDDEIRSILRETGEDLAPDVPNIDNFQIGDSSLTPEGAVDVLKLWKKAGNAGVAAGATALGGGGPVVSALAGYLGKDNDATSGQGIASNVLNMAAGPLGRFANSGQFAKLGPFLRGAKDAALGAGEVGGAQILGNVLGEAMGEKPTELNPLAALAGGGMAAGVPPLMGKIMAAYRAAPPQLRDRIFPMLQAWKDLIQKQGAPAVPPATVPVNTQPIAAELPAVDKNGVPSDFTQKINDLLEFQYQKNPALRPQPEANDLASQLEASLKARGMQPPSPEPQPAPAITPQPPPPSIPVTTPTAQAEVPDLHKRISERTRQLLNPPKVALTGKGKFGGSNIADDLRQRPDDAIRSNDEIMRTVSEIKAKGVNDFLEAAISDANLKDLPTTLKHLDEAFPEGEARQALRERVVEKVLGAVGETGEFGDLSIIQRLKSFGGQKFGDKTGAQVINDIFGGQDAMHHLNNLEDALSSTIEQQMQGNKEGWLNHAKIFINKHRPVIGGSLLPAGLATVYFGGTPALAGTGGALTVKAISIGADELGKLLGRSRSKWSDMLRDLVQGTQRYSPAQINAFLSELRRKGTEERTQSPEEADSEIAARFQAQQ